MTLETRPASDYPLPDLVNHLNLSFEDYIVPVQFNLPQFLTILRKDSLDLQESRVLLADGNPAGIALIARRGWTSRLAAMGIMKAMRSRGSGSWFMGRLLQEARERGDHEMELEVIEQNEPAVRLYQKAGFRTIRRLIGFVHQAAKQAAKNDLHEVDLREMGGLILKYGLPDLPWQLSGETIALLNPPARAYQKGSAYAVISSPEAVHIVIWSLLVEPGARGSGLAVDMLNSLMANHVGKTWHVPAIWPEEFGKIFTQAGFQREEISQWQMKISL
ncbi:MAG: GNAT family N-acetyltransferase [Anaerolineales bacterium]|nr:GNAT family N-acetyltransferase [Anaerolineae bacterium]PWB76897.1 MAG: GNAT family N-acetyltransferase [Anaerolineales bacterium]